MNSSLSIKSFLPSRAWLAKWPGWFVLCAGAVLMLGGVGKISFFFGQYPLFPDYSDPLLGMSSRRLLLDVGVAEAVIACLCLITNFRALSLGLVCALSAAILAYGVRLWSLKCHLPYGWMNHSVVIIHPSPLTVDYLAVATSGAFLVVGVVMLAFEIKLKRAAAFQKMSCPECGAHIRFAAQNLGQKIPCPQCQKPITLRKPDLLKMSCFFCKGHIEFPSHALGQKLKCPHCENDITLKDAATT